MNNHKPTIGIIGAGKLSTVLAKQLLKKHYTVHIANSRGPETLALIVQVLLPGATAGTVESVIKESDVVILAIPLHNYTSLKPEHFQGKIVIDAMNYWAPTEGVITEFQDEKHTSSEVIQQYLPEARVVKTLNHVAYNELEEHSLEFGSTNRRAIALAGDNTDAKKIAAQIIHDIGFDPVDLGELSTGRKIQPDTKLFNVRVTEAEMKKSS
jgi:predicted dinucleotide-binding enzyme